MPPAIIAAGVGAAGALGGGILQSRAAGKASDLQARATEQALEFEREREARRREEYDREQRQKQEQWEADQRRLSPYRLAAASVLAKYGIDIPAADAAPTPDLTDPSASPPEVQTMGGNLGQLGQFGMRRPYGS